MPYYCRCEESYSDNDYARIELQTMASWKESLKAWPSMKLGEMKRLTNM